MIEPAREHPLRLGQWAILASAFLAIAAAFYVYTYNSGYGYDACEYLVIGRSLLDGFRISAFVLSKGWAMYAMTAGALALIPAPNHTWIAFVITVLFALAVAGTWWIGRRLFGTAVAAMSALLVAACGFFMEVNFLEPEIPVYLSGLLAVYALEIGRPAPRSVRGLLAGLSLGIGFAFKAVALLYLAAIFGYLLLSMKHLPLADRLRSAIWVACGFAFALAVPAGYFAATGQLRHHIEWSFLFPLLHYPANTFWLRKLYTKLLWFFVLLLGACLLSATPLLRKALFGDVRVWLVLWMGFLSLLSLFKTQSSHYVFPGAAFLSFFIAQTLGCWWRLDFRHKTFPLWIPVSAVVLMAVSAYLYKPAVFGIFSHKRDFSEEARLASRLQTIALPDDRVLFLHSGKTLYWLADRYPNVPLVDTDVQPTYLLFHQPELLTEALDDPRLKLVEFDPQNPRFDDPRFLETEHHRNLINRFSEQLQERFTRLLDPAMPLSLWVRKTSYPVTASSEHPIRRADHTRSTGDRTRKTRPRAEKRTMTPSLRMRDASVRATRGRAIHQPKIPLASGICRQFISCSVKRS